ncbi:OmpA family protein [Pseudobacteriovorax antillogorgiicola]|nr:OmpA family protein [Pseudobacteriovorax antillogorgiicola]
MKLALATSLLLAFGTVACTDDEKKVEEVVAAETPEEHKFEVDEESGKVEFKAEIVYFGFDEYTLTPQGIERLTALANYMKDNQKLKIKVEGHCDSRGSTEYNLALGQRRAESVRKFLLGAGVEESRLLAVSFGEERPANSAADEKAFAENRRAEFTFENHQSIQKQADKKEVKSEKKAIASKKDDAKAEKAKAVAKAEPEAPAKKEEKAPVKEVKKKVAKKAPEAKAESPIETVSDAK